MNDHNPTVAEICGAIGQRYTAFGMSPPFALRQTAENWIGLPLDKIVDVVEEHLFRYRELYRGSGDRYFPVLCRAIERLIDPVAGVPAHDRAPPRRKGVVRKLYRSGGFTDAFDDRDESELDVSRLNAPQPVFNSGRPEHIAWQSLDSDEEG